MPVQAAGQVVRAASGNGSGRGHDLPRLELRGEGGGFGFLCHGLASFCVCDPSDRGRRKQGRCQEAGRQAPHTGVPRSGANGAGMGLTGRPASPRFRHAPTAGGTPSRGPRVGQGTNPTLQITPSGLGSSSTARSCSSTATASRATAAV